MPLELNTLTFNHDPAGVSTSAMNIRRNRDFEVPVPEYVKSVPRPPALSCAAYSVVDTKGQNVFIRAEFGNTPSSDQTVTYEIKATGGGIAGAIDPFVVVFPPGSSLQIINIPLSHRNFSAVNRQDITWQWFYRKAGSGDWQNLVATSHRIYVVLAIPPSPWSQAPGDKRNPWGDLLDECCVIASGSSNTVTATKMITKKIYSSYNLRYDIVSGAPRYGYSSTGSSFNLTNWINYVLRGNAPGNPLFCPGTPEEYRNYRIVNCYDCAASLSLMSQAVGAPAGYYFHGPFGYLKYVVPIGRGKCNNPFYGCLGNNPAVGPDDQRTRFGNHAYTKLNGAKNYDATMKEWLSGALKAILILIWFIILIFSFGTVNRVDLLERAGGWLCDVLQADYEQRTIDKSQPFEANAAAGGSPALQTLQFQVA